MTKNILYFHGFKSSSGSNKAQAFKRLLKNDSRDTKIFIPDIEDNFKDAIKQINKIIEGIKGEIFFAGSSLGGYFAKFYAEKYNSKAVLINPAIYPLVGFEEYLGENINYVTKKKFNIGKSDIEYLRSLQNKKIKSPKNFMILVESGDEILNYLETVSFFKGSEIDIVFGGDHSYSSFEKKYNKIHSFLKL